MPSLVTLFKALFAFTLAPYVTLGDKVFMCASLPIGGDMSTVALSVVSGAAAARRGRRETRRLRDGARAHVEAVGREEVVGARS